MTGGTVEESLATRAGQLFSRYRAGEEASMAELVAMVTPILWHTARASRLDGATTEDVLQSVWLALVRKADTIAEPLAILQWLVVTTRREAWRVAKMQTRVRPEEPETVDAARTEQEQDVADSVIRNHRQSVLWQHLEQLPERCRTLLRVIAFADRPDYADLARALGMPQGSIGPTRGRCLAKLRLLLANDPKWEAS